MWCSVVLCSGGVESDETGVMWCDAVCCWVLWCVVVCCGVVVCGVMCCDVLQCGFVWWG